MAAVKMKDDDARGIERWLRSAHFKKMLIRVKHDGVAALSAQEKLLIAELARRIDAKEKRFEIFLREFERAIVEHKFRMPAATEGN